MVKVGISRKFGLVVRSRRIIAGLTQEALAEKAKLHPTYISMVERGLRNPTLEAAAQIADALQADLPELLREAMTQSSGKGGGK